MMGKAGKRGKRGKGRKRGKCASRMVKEHQDNIEPCVVCVVSFFWIDQSQRKRLDALFT